MERLRQIGEVLGSLKALMVFKEEIKINRNQCTVLVEIYNLGFDVIADEMAQNLKFEERLTKWKVLDQPLRELHRTVKEGEAYIRQCLEPKEWLVKAICLAQNNDCVEFHIHNFFMCFCIAMASVPSAMGSSATFSSVIQQENGSPLSASSATGFDPNESNQVNCQSPVSSVEGSNPPSSVLSEQENGFPSSSSSSANFSPLGPSVRGEYNGSSSPAPKYNESSSQDQPSTNVDSGTSNATEVVVSPTEIYDGCASKKLSSETKRTSLKLFGKTVFVTDCQRTSATATTPSMTEDQKSSASAFGKEDSADNSARDENFQTESHLTCMPQIPLEKSSLLQDPIKDSSCKSTWNSLRSDVPRTFYCLQYPQKDPNLDGVAVAPRWAVYGNFPFFMQSSAPNDPSNPTDAGMPCGRGGVANLNLGGAPRHLAMPAVDNNNKETGSPTGSGTSSASERCGVEDRFSFSNEGKFGFRNSGLFNRIRSSGKGFVPYRRCIAESGTEEMPPLDGNKEEKRIRLCL